MPAYEILIFIALSSDYTCPNVQTQQSLSCWREKHTNRHLNQHMIFRYCDEALTSLCKCADSPEPSLPEYGILVLIALSSDNTWANAQTLQSLRCWRE